MVLMAQVFLVSGLTLRMSHLRQLGSQWGAVAYGIVAILFLTPLLALLAQALPLDPAPFREGLALFFIVPTTLNVGVALTMVSRFPHKRDQAPCVPIPHRLQACFSDT
jgi:sodium/bile acid cotransporter 7